MFVGHYSIAFAAKSEKNKIPLWVLFIAVQFLDYIWATLVLLDIEKLRVIKGFTAGSVRLIFPSVFTQSDRSYSLERLSSYRLQGLLRPTRLPLHEIRRFDRRPGCVFSLDSRSDCASAGSRDL